jgi:hypothetical protein
MKETLTNKLAYSKVERFLKKKRKTKGRELRKGCILFRLAFMIFGIQ